MDNNDERVEMIDENNISQESVNENNIQQETVEEAPSYEFNHSVVKNLDGNTAVEITEVDNRYDPSVINKGSDLRAMQPLIKKRTPFNKYDSFERMNRNGGFVRMAGIGSLIAVAAFIILYLMFKQ